MNAAHKQYYENLLDLRQKLTSDINLNLINNKINISSLNYHNSLLLKNTYHLLSKQQASVEELMIFNDFIIASPEKKEYHLNILLKNSCLLDLEYKKELINSYNEYKRVINETPPIL